MGYDVHLQKPPGTDLTDNRVWVDALCSSCPFLDEEPCDREGLASAIAEDCGLSTVEYLARGIGLQLIADLDELWVYVNFGTDVATVTLPNFPECGIEGAREQTRRIFDTLVGLGFVPLDPLTGDPCPTEFDERFDAGYRHRGGVVSHVATLTKGHIPGK